MTLPAIIDEVVCCSAIEGYCICCLPQDHDGEHLCGCGGSWAYDEEGKMIPHMFPGGLTEEQATRKMNDLVMGLFSWPGDDDYDDELEN